MSSLPSSITESFVSALGNQANVLFTKLNSLKGRLPSRDLIEVNSFLTSDTHISSLTTLQDTPMPPKTFIKINVMDNRQGPRAAKRKKFPRAN